MENGGLIKIQAENINIDTTELPILKKGRYVKITIEDQGTGIPAEIIPKIFKDQDIEKAAIFGSGRVLVIDDEETIRDFVCNVLGHFGYEAGSAGDGAGGIELYKKAMESGHPYDVVIMDLTMPGGMSGIEATKELLKIDSGAKVIVSSGYSKDPIMTSYEEYGFRDVLVKPYIHTKLCEVIHRAMG